MVATAIISPGSSPLYSAFYKLFISCYYLTLADTCLTLESVDTCCMYILTRLLVTLNAITAAI